MNRDLEIRHCRVLLAVAEAGGVGAAARALGLAQSTVSETLLSLERLLRAPVLVRRPGRETALTPMARALLPHARALVAASEAALAAATRPGPGPLRLGAVESISSFLLPAPLSALRQLWPNLDVQVAIGLCDDLRRRVVRAELDAALTIESAERARGPAHVHALAPIRLRLVVAPGHPLARGPARRAELAGRTYLLADPEGAFYELFRAWAGPAARLESAGSVDGVKRGVLGRDAIGVLPDYAVAGEIAVGALAELTLDDPPPSVLLQLSTAQPPAAGTPLTTLAEQLRRTVGATA
jgi:DNA-binding transcriptional LysR family regulator